MKHNNKSYFVFLILLNACASDPLIIEPQDKNVSWKRGKPYIATIGKIFKLKAVPVSSANYALIYNVEVVNLSSEDVIISPTEFHLSGPALKRPISAVNPEEEIRFSEEMISRADSRIGGSGFEVAVDLLSSFARIFEEENDEQRKLRLEREESQARRDQAAYARINNLRTKIDTYETKFLRKTTLKPYESLQGQIQFKSSVKPGLLQLSLESPSEQVKLDYMVRK